MSGALRVLQTNVLGCIFFSNSVQGTGDKRARKKNWKCLRSSHILSEVSLGKFPHRSFHVTLHLLNVSSLNAIFFVIADFKAGTCPMAVPVWFKCSLGFLTMQL